MKKFSKKLISVLLTVLMIVSIAVPASAAGLPYKMYCNDPVIYIAGGSGDIYYDNDTKTFRIDDLFSSDDSEESDNSKIYEATANILLPFILEGIAMDKWDNYYAAVEKEIGDLFEPIRLDCNGNVPEGSDSGIGQTAKNKREYNMTHDLKSSNGLYEERAYYYSYDWRLDPIELADDLHEYIEGVKQATGRKKVLITTKCLGTNVVLAYLNKYGTDSIKGLGIDAATSNGADFLSGAISGDFGLDGHGIVRLLKDVEVFYGFKLSPIITATLELLVNTGVMDKMTDTARELIYEKVEYGIISALATGTFMTFPCYWALVSVDDFDDALVYAFGEEGSAKRKQYAGLISKISAYNETIKKNVNNILLSTQEAETEEEKVNLCLLSKYGSQLVPIVQDSSVLGDMFVSAKNSSFGATTSTVYDTLSDEYIQMRKDEGKGKYISPDKQIDASTALFPDYTWFIKGCEHGSYSPNEIKLILTVIDADRQLTVDDFDWTQFIMYNVEDRSFEPMTEDNCHDINWTTDEEFEKPQTKHDKIKTLVISLIKWVKVIFSELIAKIKLIG